MQRSRAGRLLKHLFTDHATAHRAFPADDLVKIGTAIAQGEKRHRGQVRFVVEPALPLARVAAGLAPRDRALEVFGLLRIWDTEENCGALLYLLLADSAVEIVADRGIHRKVGAAAWEAVCRKMEAALRDGRHGEAALAGVAEINALLATHFPNDGTTARANELPDAPVVL